MASSRMDNRPSARRTPDLAGRPKAGARSTPPKERAAGAGSHAAGRPYKGRRQEGLLRYAADNAFVRGVYSVTTGRAKPFFILAVVAAALVALYFPVRDYYIAVRTQDILSQQVAIRKKYNKALDKEVQQYLSQEGIEDAARKDLGMTMPGEKTITVEGLDGDGNPVVKEQGSDQEDGDSSDSSAGDTQDAAEGSSTGSSGSSGDGGAREDSGKLKGTDAADKSKTATSSDSSARSDGSEPSTSSEVEQAERAVYEDSAWYWKLLDTIFFFDGVGGMAVVSTGE